jgi:cytochrome b6-f complex iron-sulfur subunit
MSTRRQFLGNIALWSTAVSALFAIFGIITMLIPRFGDNKRKIKLSRASDYPFSKYTFIPEAKIFLYRERKGVKALSAICTHLGCTLIHTENGFRCPCHGSCYDLEGKVTTGPAPANLAWFKLSQNWDGALIVHKNKKTNHQYLLSNPESHE